MHIVHMDQKISNMEAKALDMEGELIKLRSRTSTLDGRLEGLDKFFGDYKWSKELFEDFNKGKGGSDVNLNKVIVLARDIVTKEIEKHAADGLGRADYALTSIGAFVTKHSSEPEVIRILVIPIGVRHNYRKDSDFMLTPSFGQPGECFSLDGNSGFVEIMLSDAIIYS